MPPINVGVRSSARSGHRIWYHLKTLDQCGSKLGSTDEFYLIVRAHCNTANVTIVTVLVCHSFHKECRIVAESTKMNIAYTSYKATFNLRSDENVGLNRCLLISSKNTSDTRTLPSAAFSNFTPLAKTSSWWNEQQNRPLILISKIFSCSFWHVRSITSPIVLVQSYDIIEESKIKSKF